MSKVALSYDIPFVDTMIMPAGWARWLASQRSSPNKAIRDAEKVSETTTWRYEDHGLLPCMQFFYDWRFADLTGDGKVDYILTCGTIARSRTGRMGWNLAIRGSVGQFFGHSPGRQLPGGRH